MILSLFKTNNDSRTCIKVLEQIANLNIQPNAELNLLKPSLTIPYSNTYLTANYCYIDEFNRYYFINDMSLLNGKMLSVSCSVDPLTSFYKYFKSSIGFCTRNENDIQPWIKDELRPVAPYTTTRVLKLDNNIFNIDKANPNTSTNFLLTVSGANKKQSTEGGTK